MWEIFRPDYRAHAVFVAPARDKAELWRLVVGLALIAATFVFLSQAVWSSAMSFVPTGAQDAFAEDVFAGATPAAVLFILFQIGLLIPAVTFAAMALHQRMPSSLLGDRKAFVTQFTLVLAAQVILTLVLFALPPYSYDGTFPSLNLSFGRWLVLLPLGLGVILLQCAAEEIAFRGYVQQQLAARFRHPLIWMGLPSALFAYGHYMPDEAGSNAVGIAILAGLFGLAMADITARAGTLGPAIAIHFANNVSALLLVAPAGDMSSLALYTLPFGLEDEDMFRALLPIDLAATLVTWLAARLVLRR